MSEVPLYLEVVHEGGALELREVAVERRGPA